MTQVVDDWQQTRSRLNRDRLEERAQFSLAKRIARVRYQLSLLPQLSASQVGHVSPSAESSKVGPPFTDEFAVAHLQREDVVRLLELVESTDTKLATKAVEALETALDCEMGWSHTIDVYNLMAEEKDKLILTEYEGLKPFEISLLQPGLGDPLTIRRVRIANKRDPHTGYPVQLLEG